jgi:hypothetical protein
VEKDRDGTEWAGDAAMILERIEQMHEELYRNYLKFEETKMELQERLKTHSSDAVID